MPDIAGKKEAQQRVYRIEAFLKELAQLEAEGALTLSDEQRQRLTRHVDELRASLAARFDVDTTERQVQISWGMRVASALGGVALCVAVFLFFYRFWGLLGTPVQIGILVLAPLSLVFATAFAAGRERTPYFTLLLALVAIASFVLNLTVLGSIFNLTPTPNALLAWGAFALALAYGYGIRIPLAAGLLSLLGWMAATLVSWNGSYWTLFNERPENVMAGGIILVALSEFMPHRTLTDFPMTYRMTGLLAVFIPVLVLSFEGRMSYIQLDHDHIESIYLLAGLLLAGIVIWRGVRTRSRGLVNLGTVFFNIFLFVRLQKWWWDVLPKYLFFLIIGLIFIGLLLVFKRLRNKMEEARIA